MTNTAPIAADRIPLRWACAHIDSWPRIVAERKGAVIASRDCPECRATKAQAAREAHAAFCRIPENMTDAAIREEVFAEEFRQGALWIGLPAAKPERIEALKAEQKKRGIK